MWSVIKVQVASEMKQELGDSLRGFVSYLAENFALLHSLIDILRQKVRPMRISLWLRMSLRVSLWLRRSALTSSVPGPEVLPR